MPSLLEQLNQVAVRQRRPGVQVYAPGRQVQQAVTPPRPHSQRQGSRLDQMLTAFSSTPEAQKEVQQKAEEEARRNLPLWGKGLGLVFGNPVSRAVLGGMDYLAYPRRTIQVGLEELTKITPEWAEWGLNKMIDEDASEGRSAWDRISDPNYGFGSIIEQGSNEGGRKWLNRALGLGGDVLLDPTTYITGGATKALEGAQAAQAGTRAWQASRVANEAAAGLTATDDAARLSGSAVDDLNRIIAEGRAAQTERGFNEANEAYRLAREAPGGVKVVPARANRAGRIGELGELTLRQGDDWVRQHADELQLIAQRGYSAARTPEVRQALGLIDPKLRFGGLDIPGTGGFARGLERTGGAIRGAINERTPAGLVGRAGGRGMEREFVELLRDGGTPDDITRALTKVGMANVMREGKEVQMRGNVIWNQLAKNEVGRLSPEERVALVREAETPGVRNSLNDFFDQMATIYEDVANRKVHRLGGADGDSYVPHMLTDEFRRFLAGRSPEAEEFRKVAGFTTDDLLEGSGYLEKARQLTPGKVVKIGGNEVTIGDGTIADLNQQLRQFFPDIQKFYEDDPFLIAQAYVGSLSRGAGKERAVQRAASAPTSLVQRIEGPLEDARRSANEAYEAQDNIFNALASDADLSQPLPTPPPLPSSAEARAAVPEGQVDPADFFRGTTNKKLTREREQLLRGPQARAMLRSSKKAGRSEYDELVAEVTAGRERLRQAVLEVADQRKPASTPSVYQNRIKKLERQLANLEKSFAASVAKQGVDRPANRAELTKFLVRTQGEIEDMEAELARQVQLGARRTTAARKRAPKEVEKHLARLREIEERALALVEDPAPLVRAIREQKEFLDRPVLAAERALEAKAASIPPRYTPEEVAVARAVKQEANLAETEGRVYAARRLARADRILAEDAKWRDDIYRLTQPERDALKRARERRRELRNSMRYTIGKNAFEESTEGRLLSGVETMVRERPLREELAEEATRRRTEAETRRVSMEDEARRRLRLESEAKTEELLAPLVEDIAQATGKRKTVLEDASTRIRLMDENAQTLRALIQTDTQDLLKIRRDMANMKEATDQAATIGTDIGNVGKQREMDLRLKEFSRKVLEPMEKVAAANTDLDDEALNLTESLLDDAAQRMLSLGQRDLNERHVEMIMQKASDGQLAPVMMATLNDQWRLMHPGPLGEGSVIMDAELARRFQNLFELTKEPNWFGRTLNSLTNLFKTYATLSPGFHVRNALSAIFMNTSDGVSLANQRLGMRLWREYKQGGEEWLTGQPQTVRDAFSAAAATGAGGRFTESGVAEMVDATKFGAGTYNRLASNRATRMTQRVGSDVEGAVRLGMAIDSMKNGETVQGAIQRISRIHFDYADVSRIDEQAKRLIPFWTFMSRNLPLQISQIWTKPRVYQQYQNLVRNFSEDNPENTPQYWLDAGAFNTGLTVPENNLPIVGAASGLPIFGSPDLGFTRLKQDTADIERALSGEDPMGVLSNVNPWFTAPAEYVTRRDFYTGQEFPENEDFQDVGGLMNLLKPIAMATGNMNEAGQVDPRFLNALGSVNPIQGRTERLLPQATGGDDEDLRRQTESIARFLGVPVRTLTPKQQDNEYLRRYYAALDEMRRQQQLAAASQ